MNAKLILVVGQSNSGCGVENAAIATIKDLHLLNLSIPYGDITPFLRQNCDATSRVLTQDVVDALASTVVNSQSTQLYIQASV